LFESGAFFDEAAQIEREEHPKVVFTQAISMSDFARRFQLGQGKSLSWP